MTDKHQIADDLTTLAYPIEKLKHLDGNPRKGNVEAVKKSYKKFGQRKPIVATKDGEVISGNHQLAAARELGWNKIAVVFTDDDELTAKAFALADNRTADLGTYDDDLLADMLGAVSSDLEMLEATSFSEKDLFNLIGNTDINKDEIPEVIDNPKVKRRQKYKLGNHYLMCGDSTNTEEVNFLLNNANIEMTFIDPPYNALESWNKKWGKGETRLDPTDWFENDNFKDWNEYETFLNNTFKNIKGHSYYICCDYRIYDRIVKLLTLPLKHCIVWKKNVWGLGKRYRFQHEFLVYACDDKAPFYGDRSQSDVWEVDVDRSTKHNTPKPVALVEKAIINSSDFNSNILDLFGGSGTTLIAAEKQKRNAYVMELSEKFCDLTIQRWENLTGQKAELIDEIKVAD
jgi:DNA modification methylase